MNPECRLTNEGLKYLASLKPNGRAHALVQVQYPVLKDASSNGLANKANDAADIT